MSRELIRRTSIVAATWVLCAACGSSSGSPAKGTGGHANGGSGGKGATQGSGGNTTSNADSGPAGLPFVPGTPDTSVQSALPSLPAMENVVATAVDDNVDISFFPIDGAKDYRVYVLPDDKDVSSDSGGHVTVQNAIYRCAGNRQAPPTAPDGKEVVSGGNAISTLVDNQDVEGYTRQLSDATLGYVYATAGDGRIPVYAMGDPGAEADNNCYFQRWQTSRSKMYVTADADRQMLLSKNWRDDGIAFYVPATADSTTRTVYTSTKPGSDTKSGRVSRYYFIDGPEAMVRDGKQPAFQVLTDGSASDVHPLMRVFYANVCGQAHDELAPGQSYFDRAYHQGDQIPVFNLHWAGLTGQTTLVVEALADMCPYPGFFAPKASPAYTDSYMRDFPQWMTLQELQGASSTGEVYINGQGDGTASPRPIARSFVKIGPGPAPDMDWFMNFNSPDVLSGLTAPTGCAEPNGGTCWQTYRETSASLDTIFMEVETPRHGMVAEMGELWLAYDDVGADVNSKFRFTPTQKGQLTPDSFLHATMTVDTFTTGRRYPQIMISDQDPPVQWHMTDGNTLVLQTFVDWPNTYQIEVCDHKLWDVNSQCPAFDMYHVMDPNDSTKVMALAPNDEVGEHVGMDKGTRLDLYASTKLVYMFLDDKPYGCANLPTAGVPNGAVTVTFGDVLYHSDADHVYTYTGADLHRETRRHFDNLGFKSGVPAPTWDANRLPCVSKTIQQ